MRYPLLASAILSTFFLSSTSHAQNRNFFNRGGVGLFNPIIDVVNTGTSLVIQPTVSADRKYVTLTGKYQSAQLVALQNFQVFGVANGQGGGVVGGGGGGAGGGAQQGAGGGAIIQQPIIQFIGGDIGASIPLTIQTPGPGPVMHQQGMFLISPP